MNRKNTTNTSDTNFTIRHSSFVILSAALLLSALTASAAQPIRALFIAGGCCHDYEAQKKILTEGISARANVTWTIYHEKDDTRTREFGIYTNANWAKGYDVIVHDECSGTVSNVAFIDAIAKVHQEGVPAVMLHCAIHSYRFAATDEWRKTLGISSMRHQTRRPFEVVNVKSDHPIMKAFPTRWQDEPDELYEVVKEWPNCIPLGKAITPDKTDDTHTVIWVNNSGKARVFGTTLGHGNETVSKDVYLDLVTRGLLWTCDKLDADGKPKSGYEKQ
jgi:type 1 glutamine amidotransferase